KEGCRLRQSKGEEGSDGSPRRAFDKVSGRSLPKGCAPTIQHTVVIAKEACRLRQSKGEEGSDGWPRRFAPAIQHTLVIAKEGCRLRQSKGGWTATSLRSFHTTHICHCEGGLPTAAIQGRGGIRWIATSLRSSRSQTGGEVHCHYHPTARRWSEHSR